MKTSILSVFIFLLTFASVSAQVENDDMYFNSRDREKLKQQRGQQEMTVASRTQRRSPAAVEQSGDDNINPTDSYSARNINPEYSARTNSSTAQADNGDYFVPNYRMQNSTNFNQWNNNFSNWYGNSWYRPNYWNSSINGWNSPFYGSYYDSWGNPWNNPYYRSGWSSSFSYHWGNNWNYGWGGFNDFYNCPNNGWGSSFWGPSYAFGGGWNSWNNWGGGWNAWNRGGWGNRTIIVVENDRYQTYGRRTSRGSNIGRDYSPYRDSRTTGSSYSPNSGGGRTTTGGRVSSNSANTGNSNPEYYNRGWRNREAASTGSDDGRGNSSGRTSSSSYSGSDYTNGGNTGSNTSRTSRWNSGGNSSGNNSTYTPSRNSGYDGGSRSTGSSSYGSGSRSSGSSGSYGGGGGSPSRSRGR